MSQTRGYALCLCRREATQGEGEGEGSIINNIVIQNPAAGRGCRLAAHGALVSFFLSFHAFTGAGVSQVLGFRV
jgi:hypothetical protein